MVAFERAVSKFAREYYKILDDGRNFQRAQGFTQWTDDYPNLNAVLCDIGIGAGYAITVDGKIAGYCCICFDGEPAYSNIDGKWNYNEPYAVVHRLALSTDFRGTGLSGEAWRLIGKFCKQSGYNVIRVDTGLQNKIMQRVLEKNGFKKCGTVNYGEKADGLRLAYDKRL